MPSQTENTRYTILELTDHEHRVLNGILTQIHSNIRNIKNDNYLYSECGFIFDKENGMYKAFNQLYSRFENHIADLYKKQRRKYEG